MKNFRGVIFIIWCCFLFDVVVTNGSRSDHQLQLHDRDITYTESDYIHVMQFNSGSSNRFGSRINLVLLRNLDDYYLDIRRICWLESYLVDTCDHLLQHAQSIIEVYKNGFTKNISSWDHYCIIMNLAEFECQNHWSLVYNLPDFVTPYEKVLEGYSGGVTEVHVTILNNLVSTLLDRGCVDEDASLSFRNYLQYNLSRQEFNRWRHPSKGVFRDVTTAWVPCSPKHWIGGLDGLNGHPPQQMSWMTTPMRSHQYNKETSIARCSVGKGNYNHPQSSSIRELWSTSSSTSTGGHLTGKIFSDWNLYCPELLKLRHVNQQLVTAGHSSFTCLVVSVINKFSHTGISLQSRLTYELEMAAQFNCKVYVFYSIQEEIFGGSLNDHPNIQLCPVDISHFITNIKDHLEPVFNDLRSARDMRIDVLHLDASGLEFNFLSVLKDLQFSLDKKFLRLSPIVDFICNIHMNVQLDGGTVFSYQKLLAIAEVWHALTSPYVFNYEIWYLHHYHRLNDFRPPHRIFQTAGLIDGSIVFELGLHRAKCKPTNIAKEGDQNKDPSLNESCRANDTKINSTNEMKATEGDQKTSKAERSPNIRRQGLMRQRLVAAEDLSEEPFLENYNAMVKLNLTVAIVSFKSDMHTEVVGPLVDLLTTSGIHPANIIVYNDLDAFEYSMISVVDGWQSWDIRHTSRCFQEAHLWDLLLITTGDDFIRRDKEFSIVPLLKLYRNKTITIQHHPHWILPELFPRWLMLTPIVGHHKWIFPILKIAPKYLPASSEDTTSLSQEHRFLLLLGHIMEPPQTPEMWSHMNCKYKDIVDMHRFLSANSSNTLVAAALWPDAFDSELIPRYPFQTLAFRDLKVNGLLEVIRLSPYIWVPVTRNSTYLTGVFSSVLSLGFGLRKVIIMPDYLSDFYNFNGAVVTYKETILEVDFDAIDQKQIRKQMEVWLQARSIQNSVNFLSCVFGSC